MGKIPVITGNAGQVGTGVAAFLQSNRAGGGELHITPGEEGVRKRVCAYNNQQRQESPPKSGDIMVCLHPFKGDTSFTLKAKTFFQPILNR